MLSPFCPVCEGPWHARYHCCLPRTSSLCWEPSVKFNTNERFKFLCFNVLAKETENPSISFSHVSLVELEPFQGFLPGIPVPSAATCLKLRLKPWLKEVAAETCGHPGKSLLLPRGKDLPSAGSQCHCSSSATRNCS